MELGLVQKFGKDPCDVCLSRVTTSFIFSDSYSSWIHKKCTGRSGTLKPHPSFRCELCTRLTRPGDSRPISEVTVGMEKLEMVPYFCYLWDIVSSGYGCELTSIKKCPVTWGIFNEFLPISTSRSFPITYSGIVYTFCDRSAMLHVFKTWAPNSSDLHHWQRNDRAIAWWMCGVITKDQARLQGVLERMQCDDLEKVLRTHQLRWYGHVKHIDNWLKTVQKLNPRGGRGHGRSGKTRSEVSHMDCLALGLTETNPPIRTHRVVHFQPRSTPPLHWGWIKSNINYKLHWKWRLCCRMNFLIVEGLLLGYHLLFNRWRYISVMTEMTPEPFVLVV